VTLFPLILETLTLDSSSHSPVSKIKSFTLIPVVLLSRNVLLETFDPGYTFLFNVLSVSAFISIIFILPISLLPSVSGPADRYCPTCIEPFVNPPDRVTTFEFVTAPLVLSCTVIPTFANTVCSPKASPSSLFLYGTGFVNTLVIV